ncbi:MAG: bifunctional hydroxymethylpyrimidine kinase/phosphomethylpyrimidine kinase [Chloroflexia bacterium]|nr:bifunctional hydroxymethylpyrimidine kinase/phosphomethylpyrimidine kinase [Chloroflexia bacterium]
MDDPVPVAAPTRVPKAMTIAGSDSGGGAGIQADLKTFAAFGVYGTSVLAAITAQNTRGVFAIAEVPEEVIAIQIDVTLEDIGADAVKTGMLSSASIVETVADRLEAWGLPLVVDPVMVAKSGDHLLQPTAVGALKRALLPLATVVTPNAPEAEVLSGRSVGSLAEAREAAKAIADLGPRVVIVKGGHLPGPVVDLVWDGTEFHELSGERIETTNTHGTGDTFSAAIASGIALGHDLLPAIETAKRYLTGALRCSYAVGDGHSPVNHFWNASRGVEESRSREDTGRPDGHLERRG